MIKGCSLVCGAAVAEVQGRGARQRQTEETAGLLKWDVWCFGWWRGIGGGMEGQKGPASDKHEEQGSLAGWAI